MYLVIVGALYVFFELNEIGSSTRDLRQLLGRQSWNVNEELNFNTQIQNKRRCIVGRADLGGDRI